MVLTNIMGLSHPSKLKILDTTMEFHQLKKIGLFSTEEIRQIMDKYITFQAGKDVGNYSVANYVEFIEYQLNLLKTLQLRARMRPTLKTDAAEWCIINTIKIIYQDAVVDFADDYSLHTPYFSFCIKIGMKSEVVNWIVNSLKKDITKTEIWILLQDFYTNDNEEIRSGMWDIMSEVAWKFIQEILNQEYIDFDARVKILNDLFTMSFRYIRCSYFHISLLDSVKDEAIMKQLLIEHEQNPFMWNALAQRLWRIDIKVEPNAGFEYRSPKARLEQSIVKYKEGLAVLSSDNKRGLWCILINFLFSVYEDTDNAISQSCKLNITKTHLTEGIPYFTEKQFLKWIKLANDPTECLRLAEKAVATLPNSADLWREWLKYEYLKDDVSKARSVFIRGIEQLKEKSFPLWEDMLQYLMLSPCSTDAEQLFWEGIKTCPEVACKIRPMFLEYVNARKGIKQTRSVYDLIIAVPPACKEVHTLMLQMEERIPEPDLQCVERIHTIACKQFSHDMEVRLKYLEYLIKQNSRGRAKLNSQISAQLVDCYKTIPINMHAEFKSKYNVLVKKYPKPKPTSTPIVV